MRHVGGLPHATPSRAWDSVAHSTKHNDMKRQYPLKRGAKGCSLWYYRGYVIKGFRHCRGQGFTENPNMTPYDIYKSQEDYDKGKVDDMASGLKQAICIVDKDIEKEQERAKTIGITL